MRWRRRTDQWLVPRARYCTGRAHDRRAARRPPASRNRQRPCAKVRYTLMKTCATRCSRCTAAVVAGHERSEAVPRTEKPWAEKRTARLAILDAGRAVHREALLANGGSGWVTAPGVPEAPGTSWTGSRSWRSDTEIENWPLEVRE